MLKRFFGLLCFLYFLGGSGLVPLIKDFNWDVDTFYKAKLYQFIIEERAEASEVDQITLSAAMLMSGVSENLTFDVLEVLPNDLGSYFIYREIGRLIIALLMLYLGYRLFKSSYRIKSASKDP